MTKKEDHNILGEIEQLRLNLPQVQIHSATKNFLTVIYEKTPYRRIKTTLTFPEGYPDKNSVIIDIASERGVPPGLRKRLKKELSEVAQEKQGDVGQITPVLSRLVEFLDTNKFVPCWRELKQVFDKVQKSSQTLEGKGSTIAINDAKGLIKLRLKCGLYKYDCSITIDDGYPITMMEQDWGKACKIVMNSTNFPTKIETLLTIQARELVRRMQDGMSEEIALKMSNPVKAPDLFAMKKRAPKVRLTQQTLRGLSRDVETLAHVRDLRNVNAATDPNNAKVKANSARERKEARRNIGKITQSEISKDIFNENEERKFQIEEKARLEGIVQYDGSNPQPSLLSLVNFLMEKIQQLPEEICPICKHPSLPNDPVILESLYKSASTAKTEEKKKARRLARKQRPFRSCCGCWFHYSCLDKFLKEPPFGEACIKCNRRVYHPDWPSDISHLERAWAAKEARKREIEDAMLLFM